MTAQVNDADGPLILGIETSCDETAAAVTAGPYRVLSNVIATQHDLHERYAGVVPEIASRAHLERMLPVLRDTLAEAGVQWNDLSAIAVGNRPGLIGSLLVGVSAAKALAWSLQRPLIGIDHIEAHLHAGLLEGDANREVRDGGPRRGPCAYPALGLVVSGGHSSLYYLPVAGEYESIGRTIDDAIGEAYDKAATILQLGYPGGPALDALAQQGDDRAHDFPVANLGRDRLDFSFSGLKTAVLYAVQGVPGGAGAERSGADLSDAERADFAASFQRAAVRAVMKNVRKALDRYDVQTLLVGGGVSANSRLRAELTELAGERGLDLRLPAMQYCLDNAAMIAGLAAVRHSAGESDDLTLSASPRST